MNMATIHSPQMGWTPAPSAGPKWRPSLSQAVVVSPTTPPYVEPPRPEFIDSALVNMIFTGLGTVALAQLSYGAAFAKAYGTSRVYGILAGAMGAITLYNLTQVQTK